MSRGASGAFLAAALCANAALAHHSPVMFDQAQQVTLTGTVRQFQWTNPHSYIQLVVKNGQGQDEEWNLEMAAPTYLYNLGWRPATVKAGDTLTRDHRATAQGRQGRLAAQGRHGRRQADRQNARQRRHEALRSVERRPRAVRVHAAAAAPILASNSLHACRTGAASGSPRASSPASTVSAYLDRRCSPSSHPGIPVERDHDGPAAGGARDKPGAASGTGRGLGLSADDGRRRLRCNS